MRVRVRVRVRVGFDWLRSRVGVALIGLGSGLRFCSGWRIRVTGSRVIGLATIRVAHSVECHPSSRIKW